MTRIRASAISKVDRGIGDSSLRYTVKVTEDDYTSTKEVVFHGFEGLLESKEEVVSILENLLLSFKRGKYVEGDEKDVWTHYVHNPCGNNVIIIQFFQEDEYELMFFENLPNSLKMCGLVKFCLACFDPKLLVEKYIIKNEQVLANMRIHLRFGQNDDNVFMSIFDHKIKPTQLDDQRVITAINTHIRWTCEVEELSLMTLKLGKFVM